MTDQEFAAKVGDLFATLGLREPPLSQRELAAIANRLGYELRLDQEIQEEGLTIAATGEILIRRGLSVSRTRFTIAHELAHVIRGHDLSYARARSGGEQALARRQADAGAGIMLMFGPWLKAKIRELETSDPEVLAPVFGVSSEAMRIRVQDCERRNLLTVVDGGRSRAPPLSPFTYDRLEWREIERAARLAFPTGTVLQRVSIEEDFGGVDAIYQVSHRCAVQIRLRKNRPAIAADEDITFRVTEPAMIAAGTYAPIALFLWSVDGYVEAGKIIDVYRMAAGIEPALDKRELRGGPRARFYTVRVSELHDCRALLMQGGRDRWAPARLGGEQDLIRMLRR